MPYQSDKIAAVLNHLNTTHFLPAIQREFVRTSGQVVQFFDSLMRGYPIGSFLFWELTPENHDKWHVYRFLENVAQGGTHNESASTNGVQRLTLVLDGQQRLTSLLIGLKGTYTVKRKYKRFGNPDAWIRQSLYLDLLQEGRVDDNTDLGLRYNFRFMDCPPENDAMHHWFRVGRILACTGQDKYDEFRDAEVDKLPLPDGTATAEDRAKMRARTRIVEKNLDRLYEAVWKDPTISYYTEDDPDYDRVLDIFVRANQGGTKLSKSDLLLSMVTAKWGDGSAREEIYGFVDRLNGDLTRKNDLDKDFVMKTCLVLCDLPVQYRVQSFNNKNLDLMRVLWTAIKDAIERGVNLVNTFGIDRDTLTSGNALIPVIYYLYRHPKTTLLGSTPFEARSSMAIRCWLTMALLNNVFGGQSDQVLTETRAILQGQGDGAFDFPVAAINQRLTRYGKTGDATDPAIDDILDLMYGTREAYLALSLLYDMDRWGGEALHMDHIVAQKLFRRMDRDADCAARYRSLMHRLVNLELLTAHENLEKSGQDASAWLDSRDSDFRRRHLIPDDPSLLHFDRFDDFMTAREALIRQRLRALFAPFMQLGTLERIVS